MLQLLNFGSNYCALNYITNVITHTSYYIQIPNVTYIVIMIIHYFIVAAPEFWAAVTNITDFTNFNSNDNFTTGTFAICARKKLFRSHGETLMCNEEVTGHTLILASDGQNRNLNFFEVHVHGYNVTDTTVRIDFNLRHPRSTNPTFSSVITREIFQICVTTLRPLYHHTYCPKNKDKINIEYSLSKK